ncbi:MAG: S8 family serine peptidase [Pseudolabrys sp.]
MRTRRILKAVLIVALAASLPLAMSGASHAQSMFSRGKGVGVKPPTAPPGRPGMSGGGGGRGPNWGGVGAGIAAGVIGGIIMQGIANANTAPPEYYDDPPQRAQPRRVPNRTPNANRVSGVPVAGENRYVPDEIVATIPVTVAPRTLAAIEQRHRLSRVETHRSALASATLLRWRIADGRGVPAAIRALEREGAISGAQPNYVYTLQQDDQGALKTASVPVPQYALDKLNLPQAHERTRGDGVRVAVIDSGIDVSHPALQGAVVAQFNAAASPADVHNHGTGIAGLIAARGGFTGSAPAAQILAVRAFDPDSTSAQATTFAILKGLDWSVEQRARVINMSFAGPADPTMTRALLAASRKGAILVAAAGNAGAQSPPLYPAADPNVIAVTATGAEDAVFPRANRGRYVMVAAPGIDVVAPAIAGGYQVSSGTSLSAAEVSGVIALLLQRRPGLKADAVRAILTATARDLGNPGRDDVFGAGLVDAYQAVMSLEPKSAQAENPVR